MRSAAAAAGADVLSAEVSEAEATAKAWLETAEAAGKTISTGDPSIKCYACGGDHLNVDCPDDLTVTGPARAVAAVLRSYSGAEAATSVLAVCEYGWACDTVLKAGFETPYAGWLRAHAEGHERRRPARRSSTRPTATHRRRFVRGALSALFNSSTTSVDGGAQGRRRGPRGRAKGSTPSSRGSSEAQDRNAISCRRRSRRRPRKAGAKKMDAAAA